MLKNRLFALVGVVLLVVGIWLVNFKQPVSILETLPENVVGSELEYGFIYGLQTVNLNENEKHQLLQLLNEKKLS